MILLHEIGIDITQFHLKTKENTYYTNVPNLHDSKPLLNHVVVEVNSELQHLWVKFAIFRLS